jgi:hypothetical protein
MATTTVGVPESHDTVATHLKSEEPDAIARHSDALDDFPGPPRTRTPEQWAESDARRARIHKAMEDAGVTEEDILEDFMKLHKYGTLDD